MSSHHSKRKSESSSSHSHHKKKHKSSKASDSDDSGSGAPTPSIPNLTPISTDDYFLRANEFRLWLKERKKIFFEDLSSDESRKHFKKFVKRWNEGKLKRGFDYVLA
ncbi:hypothetical protein BKA69DRAFT_899904 [Paraphysoderma sedebokerense]|nr:hypothetical protein BKA69DRAFT_899904 [Paraphysoderma sedebokerense]